MSKYRSFCSTEPARGGQLSRVLTNGGEIEGEVDGENVEVAVVESRQLSDLE